VTANDDSWRAHHDAPDNLSRLARHLALYYLALIAYASLTPFSGWRWPEGSPAAFLWAPFPHHIQRDDLIVNFLAYIPFGGLLAGWAMRRRSVLSAVGIAIFAGMSVSATMELAQAFLPSRVSSSVDLLSNTAGAALGAALLGWLGSFERLVVALARFRGRVLMPGSAIDAGVALMAIWLVAQTNPSLPLMAAGIVDNPLVRPWNAAIGTDGSIDPEHIGIAFNLCGVALFASTLGRTRRSAFVLAVATVALGAALKWTAARLMLKDLVEFEWLAPDTPWALLAGAALFLACFPLPLRVRTRVAAVVIVAGAIMSKLAGNYADIGDVIKLFNWPYAQLLNFTGLTLYLNELWPALAVIYLVFR